MKNLSKYSLRTKKPDFYTRVYEVVKQIPRGSVATYGTIAILCGSPRAARAVGYALNALKQTDISKVPWQRVVGAGGKISIKSDPVLAGLQISILKKEGVKFNEAEKIDMKKYGYFPNE